MTFEQLRHFTSPFGLIVVPTLSYLLMHCRLGRKLVPNRPHSISGYSFPPYYRPFPGFPRMLRRFCSLCALISGPWVLMSTFLCAIVLLIDACLHRG